MAYGAIGWGFESLQAYLEILAANRKQLLIFAS